MVNLFFLVLFVIATLVMVLCSALSKEIGITVVAVCLVYELLIHRKVRIILDTFKSITNQIILN